MMDLQRRIFADMPPCGFILKLFSGDIDLLLTCVQPQIPAGTTLWGGPSTRQQETLKGLSSPGADSSLISVYLHKGRLFLAGDR